MTNPSLSDYASVGDVIETQCQNPYPHKLYAKLATPEACAFGNQLIQSGRWKKSPPDVAATLQFDSSVPNIDVRDLSQAFAKLEDKTQKHQGTLEKRLADLKAKRGEA